jgi:hypothetical protein
MTVHLFGRGEPLQGNAQGLRQLFAVLEDPGTRVPCVEGKVQVFMGRSKRRSRPKGYKVLDPSFAEQGFKAVNGYVSQVLLHFFLLPDVAWDQISNRGGIRFQADSAPSFRAVV